MWARLASLSRPHGARNLFWLVLICYRYWQNPLKYWICSTKCSSLLMGPTVRHLVYILPLCLDPVSSQVHFFIILVPSYRPSFSVLAYPKAWMLYDTTHRFSHSIIHNHCEECSLLGRYAGWFLQEPTFHILFLHSVPRLLVTANVVPSSPILVTLMMKVLRSSETWVLTRATRRTHPRRRHSS
jgi:hypothetical protein